MYRKNKNSVALPLLVFVIVFLFIVSGIVGVKTILENPLAIMSIVENSLIRPFVDAVFAFSGLIGLAALVAFIAVAITSKKR